MQIDAGAMRTKVYIEQLTETPGPQGEMVKTWTKYREAWAAIRPMRGIERNITDQVQAIVQTRIVMRYIPGITAKMRVTISDDRIYRIVSAVNHQERNQLLILECQEFK